MPLTTVVQMHNLIRYVGMYDYIYDHMRLSTMTMHCRAAA